MIPRLGRRRFSQLIGFLLGARVLIGSLLFFGLYITTYYLLATFRPPADPLLPSKVHLIIFCSFFSILSGGLINQFYDQTKDAVIKPFRFRLQNKIPQRYYLYAYLALSAITVALALLVSVHVTLFFVVYLFMLWLYSHKISRLYVLNNIVFVALTMYPFFGIILFYKFFDYRIILMAVFLFLLLLQIDITKDLLTRKADIVLHYRTLATEHQGIFVRAILRLLAIALFGVSVACYYFLDGLTSIFYLTTTLIIVLFLYQIRNLELRKLVMAMNYYRLWVLAGLLMMSVDVCWQLAQ